MTDLPGFANPEETEDLNDEAEDKIQKKPNRKSGGFQSMGLSHQLLKGIIKRGYKQPTPIQRKTIPLVVEGRDVVAMARTGSGKTACFLIPMLERLKIRSAKAGARALILSPTRELALQTLKFIKELGRFTDLKSSVILGGDSMDDQFSAIHGNPDIIVATPGRFLHVCIEMELRLGSVEYVVFDEADRLFEMGLGEQLTEIVHRLPDARQTVLFSATLPKVLVEFAKAGLSDPVLLRLDVESKIPELLQLWYIAVRPEERLAALLVLLRNHIDREQQTVVFVATKHHVEYLHTVLDRVRISNTYIYSNLDPSARKINTAKFSQGKVKVLIVTDVAARGIDIPQLDNVINYNFPARSKLFVHRVGRCARAGRSGTAFSIVTPDEYAYLLDLHLFLGRPVQFCTSAARGGAIGRIPQQLIEEQHEALLGLHENVDLLGLRKTADNGHQQYARTRPAASSDSNKRAKELPFLTCSVHGIFAEATQAAEEVRESLLEQMKSYRPQGTIFEICGKNKSQEYRVMKQKRVVHKNKIESFHKKAERRDEAVEDEHEECNLAKSNADDITSTFSQVIMPKKRRIDDLYKIKSKKRRVEKDENYIPYVPSDRHTETGLAVNNFHNEASRVEMDLTGDSDEILKRASQMKKWDRKKKKMVQVEDKRVGKIKTESGVWIPATYKSNRYAQWKERTKIDNMEASGDEDDAPKSNKKQAYRPNTHWAKHNEKVKEKQRGSELKSNDQILKARKIAEKKKSRQKKGGKKRSKGRAGRK